MRSTVVVVAHERVEQSEPCKEKKEYPAAEYHRAGRIVSQQFGNGLRLCGKYRPSVLCKGLLFRCGIRQPRFRALFGRFLRPSADIG